MGLRVIHRASPDAVENVIARLAEAGIDGVVIDDPNFLAVRIKPHRVELSEMFGSQNKRVWRA